MYIDTQARKASYPLVKERQAYIRLDTKQLHGLYFYECFADACDFRPDLCYKLPGTVPLWAPVFTNVMADRIYTVQFYDNRDRQVSTQIRRDSRGI